MEEWAVVLEPHARKAYETALKEGSARLVLDGANIEKETGIDHYHAARAIGAKLGVTYDRRYGTGNDIAFIALYKTTTPDQRPKWTWADPAPLLEAAKLKSIARMDEVAATIAPHLKQLYEAAADKPEFEIPLKDLEQTTGVPFEEIWSCVEFRCPPGYGYKERRACKHRNIYDECNCVPKVFLVLEQERSFQPGAKRSRPIEEEAR